MQGRRDIKKLEEARGALLAMADDVQAVIDGQRSQSSVAAAHGMDANAFSRQLAGKFTPYVKKLLVSIEDLPALVNAAMGPADRLMADILKIDVDSDKIAVLPEFDDEELLFTVRTDLTRKEAAVLSLIYGFGQADRPHTHAEAARELCITSYRVREIHAKALRKLRNPARLMKIFRMLTDVADEYIGAADRAAKTAVRDLENAVSQIRQAEAMRRAKSVLDREGPSDEGVAGAMALLGKDAAGKALDPSAIPIEDMELSVRSFNCCKRAGINTAQDILDKRLDGMMLVRNLGRRGLDEICQRVLELTGVKLD